MKRVTNLDIYYINNLCNSALVTGGAVGVSLIVKKVARMALGTACSCSYIYYGDKWVQDKKYLLNSLMPKALEMS